MKLHIILLMMSANVIPRIAEASTTSAAAGTTAAPAGTTAVPAATTAAPAGTTAVPAATTAAPAGTTASPAATTVAPAGTTAGPAATTAAPAATTAAHAATIAASASTTDAPADTTAAPAATTSAPAATTGAPGVTTAAPGATTAAPAVTTAAPGATTAAPAGTTAAPGATTAAPAGTTAMPNSCAAVSCRNMGRCFIVNGQARCGCVGGYSGMFCELLQRMYRIVIVANDETGVPLLWNATVFGDPNNQVRRRHGERLSTEVVRVFLRSRIYTFAYASYNCTLSSFREGSVLADLDMTATFPPNTTSPHSLSEILAVLADGMNASNATFGSRPSVDYANPCTSSSSGSLCSAYGTCQNSGTGSYACTCNSGFADSNPALPGTTCTQLCSSDTCPGSNRVCVQTSGGLAQCQCSQGYSGSDCSQQQLSQAIIGLIVACCVLFVLAAIALLLYIVLRRQANRARRGQRVTTLEGDAYMLNEVAKWRAVTESIRSDRSSVYGGRAHQTYPESGAASSVFIRGQPDTSAPPTRRSAPTAAGAAAVSVHRESSWRSGGGDGGGGAGGSRAIVTDVHTPVTEPAGYPVSLPRAYAERFAVDYGQSAPSTSAEGKHYF